MQAKIINYKLTHEICTFAYEHAIAIRTTEHEHAYKRVHTLNKKSTSVTRIYIRAHAVIRIRLEQLISTQ